MHEIEVENTMAAPGQSGRPSFCAASLRRCAPALRSGEESDLVATGEDGRRALELANALLLAGYRDQTVTIPVDRAAYDALLGDLRRLAAGGDRRKRKPSWERETVLGALPEGS